MVGEWGYTDLVLMTAQEPAISSVVEEAKKKRGFRTLHRKSPRYSHQSLGFAEQSN